MSRLHFKAVRWVTKNRQQSKRRVPRVTGTLFRLGPQVTPHSTLPSLEGRRPARKRQLPSRGKMHLTFCVPKDLSESGIGCG